MSCRCTNRREMLVRSANGFGAVALAAIDERPRRSGRQRSAGVPGNARRQPAGSAAGHHSAKARSVIFLYMDGGPSQVDTFDPKPRLRSRARPADPDARAPHAVHPARQRRQGAGLAVKFQRHGDSGMPVSELFPHLADCVDDLAIVRSMVADFTEHANANLFLHTGSNRRAGPASAPG